MKRNTIKASTGGVVVTGIHQGDITTHSTSSTKSNDEGVSKPKLINNRISIIAAIITAIGAVISGFLIASSNWFAQ